MLTGPISRTPTAPDHRSPWCGASDARESSLRTTSPWGSPQGGRVGTTLRAASPSSLPSVRTGIAARGNIDKNTAWEGHDGELRRRVLA